jgi:hypothetical protein
MNVEGGVMNDEFVEFGDVIILQILIPNHFLPQYIRYQMSNLLHLVKNP